MTIVPQGFLSPSVRRFDPPDLDEIVPSTAQSFVPEDHALLRGQPVVPTVWARARAAATADGTYYTGRVAVEDIQPEAYARFVPNDDTWDAQACIWLPQVSQAPGDYRLVSNPLAAPLLTETEYQIGRELLNARALVLDEDSVLTSSFDEGFDSAYSFTMAMAIRARGTSFNPITFIDGSYIGVRPTGLEAKLNGLTFTVPMAKSPQSLMPLLVVLEVAPPVVRLTAAVSPTLAWSGTSSVDVRTTSFVFTLSGEYDLFSLDLWGGERPALAGLLAGYNSALGVSR